MIASSPTAKRPREGNDDTESQALLSDAHVRKLSSSMEDMLRNVYKGVRPHREQQQVLDHFLSRKNTQDLFPLTNFKMNSTESFIMAKCLETLRVSLQHKVSSHGGGQFKNVKVAREMMIGKAFI